MLPRVLQVLRDLILSFKLPRAVVGVRRTCLLSRESNLIASEQHATTLGAAHDAAMRGARWTWEKDEDPVHKMCALLAGLAVQMCDHSQSIRKDDMFKGRVLLPFLETRPAASRLPRMQLLEHSHEWVVYTLDHRGRAKVRLRQAGYDGMVQCVLAIAGTMQQNA